MTTGDAAEVLGRDVVGRMEADIAGALRRRPAHEVKLAGALRMLAPMSAAVVHASEEALALLVRRGSFDRPLYCGAIRAVAEANSEQASDILSKALLANEEAGGLSTLSAACFVTNGSLAPALARVASSRHPHVAFAAEIARASRGESDGTHLTAIAPKIKESHRITLCVEVFLPLARAARLPATVGPALAILRDAERHLGRWLVLGQVATRASDPAPLQEARTKMKDGPGSARAAWSLVAWALSGEPSPPATRPTVELVARLSDRPSANRDTTFLFRLAAARAPTVRPMLEGLAKVMPLGDDGAVRAALYLARDHNRDDLRQALEAAARSAKREDLRGLAMAALWDAGARERALELAAAAIRSRSLPTQAWAGLVVAASQQAWDRELVDESSFRRMQLGWLE